MDTPLRQSGPVLAFFSILLLLIPATAPAMEWTDALVARVNGTPILISEVSANELLFHSGKRYDQLDKRQRFEAVSRTVERRLLLVEAERFGVPAPGEQAVEEARWVAKQRLGRSVWWLDAQTFRETVRDQLWMEDFIDARISAFIMIRDDVVTRELARQDGPQPGETGAMARARVRQTLETDEAEQRLHRYLTRLLERAEVKRYTVPDFSN